MGRTATWVIQRVRQRIQANPDLNNEQFRFGWSDDPGDGAISLLEELTILTRTTISKARAYVQLIPINAVTDQEDYVTTPNISEVLSVSWEDGSNKWMLNRASYEDSVGPSDLSQTYDSIGFFGLSSATGSSTGPRKYAWTTAFNLKVWPAPDHAVTGGIVLRAATTVPSTMDQTFDFGTFMPDHLQDTVVDLLYAHCLLLVGQAVPNEIADRVKGIIQWMNDYSTGPDQAVERGVSLYSYARS
jgi:hypothetical protein